MFRINISSGQYIMRKGRLEETEAEIKAAGRNIKNFRFADNTSSMTGSEEM